MAAKRNNAANGDVIVERVLTSDAFLAREIKKAPLKTKNGSLTADLKHLPNDLKITIQGAREHNLKNVDLEFPRNRMVVFTGLSGSGKSSLAFDTLFAEGQRRYVESLSAYARQFLGQMDKPDVDFIEGLSPAVSIDQKTTNRNPRSTVGTITEIYDYLGLLFARTGIPHCPECGALVSAQTPQQMVDALLQYPERTRFQILAPVVRGRKGEFEDLLELLRGDGYARALIDGEMKQLSDDIKLTKQKKHTIEVVVDRLVVKDGIRQRLTDSIETALKLAKGIVVAEVQQNSNVTYRVYDYGRVGADGKPRALHIEKALDVTRRTPPQKHDFGSHLAQCEYFTVDAKKGAFDGAADEKSFVSLLITDGAGTLTCGGETVKVKKGESYFIPAGSGKYAVTGDCETLVTVV